ncbi:MAG: hypothetical protein KJ070_06050 [Verrucomicrobia bacterium]|nr:hypothetical protein [Verrucomicrobiota bacterium]
MKGLHTDDFVHGNPYPQLPNADFSSGAHADWKAGVTDSRFIERLAPLPRGDETPPYLCVGT